METPMKRTYILQAESIIIQAGCYLSNFLRMGSKTKRLAMQRMLRTKLLIRSRSILLIRFSSLETLKLQLTHKIFSQENAMNIKKIHLFTLCLLGWVGLMMGCEARLDSANNNSEITNDDFSLLETLLAKYGTIDEACNELDTLCKSNGEGCSIYDLFCKISNDIDYVCLQMHNACREGKQKACDIFSSSCDQSSVLTDSSLLVPDAGGVSLDKGAVPGKDSAIAPDVNPPQHDISPPSGSDGLGTPGTAFKPFGTVTLTPEFNVNGAGSNVDSMAFYEDNDPTKSIMFVTAKSNAKLEVWPYPFTKEATAFTDSCFSTSNGVLVDQEADLLYVTAPKTDKVCVYSLPSMKYIKTIQTGSSISSIEPNLALMKKNSNKVLFVSYDRKIYSLDPATGKNIGSFSLGHDLETMYPDPLGGFLYIPDENSRTGVHAYLPDGTPYKKAGNSIFGAGDFEADGEGVWLYTCPANGTSDNGAGFIIVSDQRSTLTDFEVYDRMTWTHLGIVHLSGVSNTDGIALTQQASPQYPKGVFVALDDDTSVAGIGLDKMIQAAGLICK